MKRLIKKAAEKPADKNSWQYKKLEELGYDMSSAVQADGPGSFYDVGRAEIGSKGYKFIETTSSDYTVGSYTNGEYVITLIASQGYVSIGKPTAALKKWYDEGCKGEFDVFNESISQ